MANTKNTTGGLNFEYAAKGASNFSPLFDILWAKISSHDHEGSGKGKQLTGDALQAGSIPASKIQFDNNEFLKATNFADNGTIDAFKINTSDLFEFGTTIHAIDTNAFNIKNNIYLTGRNNADSANINMMRITTSDKMELGTSLASLEMTHDTFITGTDAALSGTVDLIKVNTSDEAELSKVSSIPATKMANPGWISNLGLTLAANVLTVNSADGTALSSSNPGYVSIPDKTNRGTTNSYALTAAQALTESDLTGNIFGSTAAVAWADDCPFYLYAVVNDAESAVQLMISRVPHLKSAPVVGLIGAPDDAVADNEYSMFSLANIDETLFDGNPAVLLGSFRMQKDTSDDWTVQTLNENDGIGNYNEGIQFDLPQNQNGADLGYLDNNSGTAPGFSSVAYKYTMNRHGYVDVQMKMSGDPGTDGVGVVSTLVSLPIARDTGISTRGHTFFIQTAAIGDRHCMIDFATGSATDQQFGIQYVTGGSITGLTNANFSNGNRIVEGILTYIAKIA